MGLNPTSEQTLNFNEAFNKLKLAIKEKSQRDSDFFLEVNNRTVSTEPFKLWQLHQRMLQNLLLKVNEIPKDKSNIEQLTLVLMKTHDLLENPSQFEDYLKFSNEVQGKPNRLMQALGGILMGLGGVALLTALVGTLFLPVATPLVAPILIMVCACIAYFGLSFCGAGIFSNNSKKDLSLQLEDLGLFAKKYKDNNPFEYSFFKSQDNNLSADPSEETELNQNPEGKTV